MLGLVAVAGVVAAVVYAVKHYGSAAVLAKVKAELALIETSGKAEELVVVNRLKALL